MQLSFNAEVSHHLVVLVLQDMAMPHVFAPAYFEREVLALVVADLHARNSHPARRHPDHIHEQLLLRLWGTYRRTPVGSYVELLGHSRTTAVPRLSIQIFPVLLVLGHVD